VLLSRDSQLKLIRSPLGQVSYRSNDSGILSGNYQYGSYGNRLPSSDQTGDNPEYYDASPVTLGEFENMTTSPTGTRDMSPLLPGVDRNAPSGSGGWGSSGNPDTASGGDTASLNNPGNWYEFGSGMRNPIHNMTGPMDAYGNGGQWSSSNPIFRMKGPMEQDGAGAGQSKQPVSFAALLSARRSAMQLITPWRDSLIARCRGGRASVRASLTTNARSVLS
jgi:hypothetical protein